MSTKDQRIVMTRKSSLPICNPNLMPFHIGHTGPAAVSMFLRVEKMKAEEEAVVVVLGKDDDEEGKVKLEVVMKEGLLQEGRCQAKPRSYLLAQNMAMILFSHSEIVWMAFSRIFHLLNIPTLY